VRSLIESIIDVGSGLLLATPYKVDIKELYDINDL